MPNYEISSGNTTLVLESVSNYYDPMLYLNTEEGKSKALIGSHFLKVIIGDNEYLGKIRKAYKEDIIVFNGDIQGLDNWQFSGEIIPTGDLAQRFDWFINIRNGSEDIVEFRIEISFDVDDTGTPRWMIPAMFYKNNRPEACIRKYPRYSRENNDASDFTSDFWAFSSDRSSCPSVFCWSDNYTSCLATSETFSDGISGIGFKSDEEKTSLTLYYPYIEAPASYSFHLPNASNPHYSTILLPYQGKVQFSFSTYVDEKDLHLYDSLIRDIYFDSSDEPNPWMSKAEASSLCAYGLYNWHYDKENNILNETCAFDSYFGKDANQTDRPHMHVSWVSGIPYAYALWQYGVQRNNRKYIDAGLSVIDKIANEGITPSGFFYSEWTKEQGWGTGWNPDSSWIHTRTAAEAVWFLIKALKYAKQNELSKPQWEAAVKSNILAAMKIQRSDGSFGTYYDVNTGEVKEWDGAGGLMWIPAFISASEYFDDSIYKDAALKAGEYYSKFVEDEYIYGAPEDVHLTPTSEDGYNALIAYISMYEAFEDEKWLELAETAADWMLSFRWTYNVKFPEFTILGKYDYKTIGADLASPANNHLHPYGLICHSELLKLWEYTGDTYYLSRAADNLACFQQFIARYDGDFNARTGMVSEQWYHTNWNHPKGSMLQLAHAWCAGMILYANLSAQEFGDIIIDAESREIYALDNLQIKETEYLDPDLVITLANQSYSNQIVKIRHSKLGVTGEIKLTALEECRVLIGGNIPKIEYLELDHWEN